MNNWKDDITISVLGLEHNLWNKIEDTEKQVYNRVILHFLAYVVCTFIASFTLVFLISSSYFASIFFGLILGLILTTIIRFSLITLRRSIFDQKDINIQDIEKTLNEEVSTKVIKDTKINSNNLFNRIKILFNNFKKSSTKNTKQIFNFSLFIRIIIITVISLLIIFPLTTILNYNKVQEVNSNKREEIKQQYLINARRSKEKKLKSLHQYIQNIESQIEQNTGNFQINSFKQIKQKELETLNKSLNNFEIENNNKTEIELQTLISNIDGKYFIITTFNDVIHYPLFTIIFCLIFYLIFFAHYKLIILTKSSIYSYSDQSTVYYKQIIEKEYSETQEYLTILLKDKYSYDAKPFIDNSFWLNPPYCTEKRKFFKKRDIITKQAFLDHFNSPQIPVTIENKN